MRQTIVGVPGTIIDFDIVDDTGKVLDGFKFYISDQDPEVSRRFNWGAILQSGKGYPSRGSGTRGFGGCVTLPPNAPPRETVRSDGY